MGVTQSNMCSRTNALKVAPQFTVTSKVAENLIFDLGVTTSPYIASSTFRRGMFELRTAITRELASGRLDVQPRASTPLGLLPLEETLVTFNLLRVELHDNSAYRNSLDVSAQVAPIILTNNLKLHRHAAPPAFYEWYKDMVDDALQRCVLDMPHEGDPGDGDITTSPAFASLRACIAAGKGLYDDPALSAFSRCVIHFIVTTPVGSMTRMSFADAQRRQLLDYLLAEGLIDPGRCFTNHNHSTEHSQLVTVASHRGWSRVLAFLLQCGYGRCDHAWNAAWLAGQVNNSLTYILSRRRVENVECFEMLLQEGWYGIVHANPRGFTSVQDVRWDEPRADFVTAQQVGDDIVAKMLASALLHVS